MAVIRDVATLAGVAVGTVSRYLKNPNSIKPANREKIEHAIKALNYFPSPVARSLRTKKTNTIAIITPSTTNPFYIEVFNAIRKYALDFGYTSILYTADDDLNKLKLHLSVLSIHPVDGIVLCLLDKNKMLENFIHYTNPNIALTIIGWEHEQNQTPSIIMDVKTGIYCTTEHQIQTGRRKIAYLSGIMDTRLYQKKYQGFADALTHYGYKIDKNLVYECSNNFESAVPQAERLLLEHPDIDGIVCATDVMAISSLMVLNEHRISVSQIAVTGFDNIPLSQVCAPPLTTIAHPTGEIGQLSFTMLKSLIDKPESSIQSTTVRSELIVRKSTPFK